MRHKNDIAIAATSARSYNRHWRAKKLSWTDIGKIKYLFDGAIEFMDEVTLTYTRDHFNQLRKALGFKQDSELTELIERSEAFRIVRDKETQQMEAFMSPLVGDCFVLLRGQTTGKGRDRCASDVGEASGRLTQRVCFGLDRAD